MRLVTLFLLLTALGCGGTAVPKCTTSTCSGCCDAKDTCQAGTVPDACGGDGKLCISCPSGQVCSAGQCSVTQCSPANCAGCCDTSGTCRTGTASEACGAAGNSCKACTSAQTCSAGVCKT